MNSPSPTKGFIPPGFLTLLCEGNNNPYSTNWSRRLRTGPKNNIVIGKGYDLTQNAESKIIQDLVDAGVPRQKAQLLAKAPFLSGFEASKFIAFYKNDVVLTKEQEKKLFDMKYKKTETIMKAKIDQYTGKSEYISPFDVAQYQWEILTDLIYSGDLTSENEEYVFSALKNALNEHDPKIFDRVVLDAHYWRKQGVTEDRLRMRCIFMNEWASFTELKHLPREETDDTDGFVAMLSKFPDLFTIEGMYVDLKQDNLNLVLKRNIAQPKQLKKTSAGTGISIEELVMALKLCCDKNINASIIGGSLHPFDPFNPEDKCLKKELYPDHYHSKSIVAGTKFAEVMYEASKIITQIATGKNIVDKGNYLEKEGDFEHLQAFKEMGILPLKPYAQTEKDSIVFNPLTIKRVSTATVRLKHSLLEITQTPRSLNSPVNDPTENKIVKFWLTIDHVKEVKYSSPEGEYFGVSEVKLGLKPCRIIYTPEGTWEERPIDDPNDQAVIFAKRFTDKYPIISKLFPVFKKVEQMCKALSLTNWLNNKNVPVDMVMVNIYYQKGLQYISSPRQTVFGSPNSPSSPNILSSSKKAGARKGAHVIMIPLESRSGRSSVTGDRSTSQNMSKHSSTKLISNYWQESTPLSPMSPKKNNSAPVFGGVLLEVGYQNPVKKNLVSGILENHAQMTGNFLETVFQDTFQIEYPFQNTMCKKCENYLKYSEIMSSINGDYYCRLHHPFSCNHCFNIIKANCFDLDGMKYHSECILCKYCEKKISGKLVKVEEGYLHVQCSEVYLKNWRQDSLKREGSPVNTPKNKKQGRNQINFRTRVGFRT